MRHIAIHIKELTTSNLNTLVGSAANPVKMLRLLQSELQESVIALQGDLSRAQRQAERLETGAAQLAAKAAEWTAKAKTAMDHKREDLARAALLTREQTAADAERMAGEAHAMAAQAGEIGEVIAELEAKLAETRERIGAYCGFCGIGELMEFSASDVATSRYKRWASIRRLLSCSTFRKARAK